MLQLRRITLMEITWQARAANGIYNLMDLGIRIPRFEP
jgi:hypothetical protein